MLAVVLGVPIAALFDSSAFDERARAHLAAHGQTEQPPSPERLAAAAELGLLEQYVAERRRQLSRED